MGIEDYRFEKGQEKTPGSGRKLGVRNKLSERFLRDLHAEWEKSGEATLKILAKENPEAFARLAVGVLPREFEGLPPSVVVYTGVRRADEDAPIATPSVPGPPLALPAPKKEEAEAKPCPLTSADMVAPLPTTAGMSFSQPAMSEPVKPTPIEYPPTGWR
jgi:hypothetical protein